MLEANRDHLISLVRNHAVQGVVSSSSLALGQSLKTLANGQLSVTSLVPTMLINERATVISRDVPATNGMIQLVDTVLLPSTWLYPDKTILAIVSSSPDLTILHRALAHADIDWVFASGLATEGFRVCSPADGRVLVGAKDELASRYLYIGLSLSQVPLRCLSPHPAGPNRCGLRESRPGRCQQPSAAQPHCVVPGPLRPSSFFIIPTCYTCPTPSGGPMLQKHTAVTYFRALYSIISAMFCSSARELGLGVGFSGLGFCSSARDVGL